MGDISQNVPLQNNDVIVVGRNLIARLTYALSTFTQPFRDVLGFVLFFDSLRDSANNLFRPSSGNQDQDSSQ
jgi:polysaccharide export outer membrane protein